MTTFEKKNWVTLNVLQNSLGKHAGHFEILLYKFNEHILPESEEF